MSDRVWASVTILLYVGIGVTAVVYARHQQQREAVKPALVTLDCRDERVQAGVPIRRLSDAKVVYVDVCGAADSADNTFRRELE